MVQVPTPWDREPLTCRVITHQQHLLTTHPIYLTDGGSAWSVPVKIHK